MFVADFYGPMYWGFVISTFLVGGTLIQGYMYYSRSRDPVSLQAMVALMLALDVASTAVMGITVFHYFIDNFGNHAVFQVIPSEWVFEAILTAIVTCIAQLFFASRIRKVMQEYAVFGRWEYIIPGLITGAALLSLVKTVIVATAPPRKLSSTSMIVARSFEEGFAAISDLFATCTLCFILASSQESMRRTRSPIRRLFFFVLNRGILVTIFQIGTLAALRAKPGYMYWVPFHLSKSKLYTNTLLAMLNSRLQSDNVPSLPRTQRLDRDVSLQEMPNRESTGHVHTERSQIQGQENARSD